jgi:hypothetical protein
MKKSVLNKITIAMLMIGATALAACSRVNLSKYSPASVLGEQSMNAFPIFLIIVGALMLVFGNRLALFGGVVGAILGLGILLILPGSKENLAWLLIPVGLSLLFALGTGIVKGLISLITLALGALAGGGLVLALLDRFSLNYELMNWVFVLVGAVIGAGLMLRFKAWTLVVMAAILGALLCTRGLQMLFPSLDTKIANIIAIVLALASVAYHGGFFRREKSSNRTDDEGST